MSTSQRGRGQSVARLTAIALLTAFLSVGMQAPAKASVECLSNLQFYIAVNTATSGAVYEASVKQDANPEASVKEVFENAKNYLESSVPVCSPEQEAYRAKRIEWMYAYAAWHECYQLYISATNVGQVNLWLACISPVNEAIISLAREAGEVGRILLGSTTQLDPDYPQPPASGPGAPPGSVSEAALRSTEVVKAAATLFAQADKAAKLNTSIDRVVKRLQNDLPAEALMQEIVLYLEDEAADRLVEFVRSTTHQVGGRVVHEVTRLPRGYGEAHALINSRGGSTLKIGAEVTIVADGGATQTGSSELLLPAAALR